MHMRGDPSAMQRQLFSLVILLAILTQPWRTLAALLIQILSEMLGSLSLLLTFSVGLKSQLPESNQPASLDHDDPSTCSPEGVEPRGSMTSTLDTRDAKERILANPAQDLAARYYRCLRP
jgi:hypothetical protein